MSIYPVDVSHPPLSVVTPASSTFATANRDKKCTASDAIMSGQSSPNPLHEFHEELDEKLQKCVWNEVEKNFLPRDTFDALLTEANIRACLSNEFGASKDALEASTVAFEALIEFLFHKARKVFATSVVSRGYRSLTPFLQRCFEYGLDDEHLPIQACASHQSGNTDSEPSKELRVFKKDGGKSVLNGSNKSADGTDAHIDRQHWRTFHDDQWIFLSPVFDAKEESPRPLDALTRLPFTQWGPGTAHGHFGDVHEAILHPAHHVNFPWPKATPCRVAVKIFKRSQNGTGTLDAGQARRAFYGEAAVLHDLSQFNHAHIAGKIAAIEYGDKCILLSQWADGGDLRKFWSSNPTPKLDARLVQQTLVQLTGLASAIHTLHTNNDRMSPLGRTVTMRDSLPALSEPPEVPRIIADGMPPEGNDIHFRHGDLKPENIFVFSVEGSQFGHCKIGDLGLAKQHFAPTELRQQKTDTKYGTMSYEPPETLTMRGRPRSRLYDIWSYGCIMFETLIWLLYGDQGLETFWNLHVNKSEGSLFFTTQSTPFGLRAKINHHTSSLMERMLAEDLKKAGTSGSALRDLLIFIQAKVLVVDLPDVTESSSCRVDATSLLAEMERIVKKAKGNGGTEYLFPNALRLAQEPRRLPIIIDSPRATVAHLAVPGAIQREVRQLPTKHESL